MLSDYIALVVAELNISMQHCLTATAEN